LLKIEPKIDRDKKDEAEYFFIWGLIDKIEFV
jgi:hypothetical protein